MNERHSMEEIEGMIRFDTRYHAHDEIVGYYREAEEVLRELGLPAEEWPANRVKIVELLSQKQVSCVPAPRPARPGSDILVPSPKIHG
jgi:uncharacterized protein (DUF2236 family)